MTTQHSDATDGPHLPEHGRATQNGNQLRTVALAALAGLVAGGLGGWAITSLDVPAPAEAAGVLGAPANPDWHTIAQRVNDSVVAIDVKGDKVEGEGSGLVLDQDGHVLTNNHVAAIGDDITIALANGELHKAKVVGSDPGTDLAVLGILEPPSGLKPASLGDSSKVEVGMPVLAIGNPLGLSDTVTSGIVSAVDRPVSTREETSSGQDTTGEVVTNAIQVDAAINPGNSGGPLFDGSGDVIGINSSIASLASGLLPSKQSGSIGLGFAIPINEAKSIADQLIKDGSADHAYLGVTTKDTTTSVDGATRMGALVAGVAAGSPADKAGLRIKDVIIGVDGHLVSDSTSLTAFVRSSAVGDKATLTVARDGKSSDVSVTYVAAPASATPAATPIPTPDPSELKKKLQEAKEQLSGN